jgi:hypothetical protein
MPIVNITGSTTDFFVYATDLAATDYLLGDISRDPVWGSLSADEKKRALISATRYLDRLPWAGAKTVSSQINAFPRTGIVDADGQEASGTPQEIVDACCILAADFVADPTILDSVSTGSNTKELQAGSVRIVYFKTPTGQTSALPYSVLGLLKSFFGAESATPPIITGLDWYQPGDLVSQTNFNRR